MARVATATPLSRYTATNMYLGGVAAASYSPTETWLPLPTRDMRAASASAGEAPVPVCYSPRFRAGVPGRSNDERHTGD